MQIKYYHNPATAVTVFTTDGKEFFVKTPSGGIETFNTPDTRLTLAGKPGALEILRHIVAQEGQQSYRERKPCPVASDFGHRNGFFSTAAEQDAYNKAMQEWQEQE